MYSNETIGPQCVGVEKDKISSCDIIRFCFTKTPYRIYLSDSNVNFKTNSFGIRLIVCSIVLDEGIYGCLSLKTIQGVF